MQNIIHKIKNIFTFLDWIFLLKNPKILKGDIIAGLTVGFVIIPQSMAYAALAWLFQATRQMATGPITIVSLMTSTALFTVVWDDPSGYMVYASLLAIFTWLFYILLWNLKLWIIVDFLSNPLIVWFTNAAAIITITSQAGKLFWVKYDKWDNYFEWIYNLFLAIIEKTHIPTLMFWLWAIIFLILLKKFLPKVPRVLVLIVLATSMSYYLWFNDSMWWEIVKDIPNTLPSFSVPFLSEFIYSKLTFAQILDLIMYSMIIWLIWFTQTISVSKYISTKTKDKIDANRELVGQWIVNIFTGFFSWYTVAWSLSKTAVNLRAWAQTWLSYHKNKRGAPVGVTSGESGVHANFQYWFAVLYHLLC